MQLIKDRLWRYIETRLFSTPVLEALVEALLPLIHERVITYLTRGFDVHVKDILRPKVDHAQEYIIYESSRPGTHWFLIDLSNAREGDRFEIKFYVKLSGGEFALHDHYELEDQQLEPIATLSARFAPACRLTITQTRGLSKDVPFEVFGRYEER